MRRARGANAAAAAASRRTNASRTSGPTSYARGPIAGPSQAITLAAGRRPCAATAASITPAASPRQPACAIADGRRRRGSHSSTGTQSAVSTAHTTCRRPRDSRRRRGQAGVRVAGVDHFACRAPAGATRDRRAARPAAARGCARPPPGRRRRCAAEIQRVVGPAARAAGARGDQRAHARGCGPVGHDPVGVRQRSSAAAGDAARACPHGGADRHSQRRAARRMVRPSRAACSAWRGKAVAGGARHALPSRGARASGAVGRIAHERMTDRAHVHADLMRAPGLEADVEQASHRRTARRTR